VPHWLIKSALQRVFSWLPASHYWNGLFQRYATHSLELTTKNFEVRLEHCHQHLEYFFEMKPERPDGFRALELGTGWFPTVPVGLYLCGAAEIWTFDIASLLRASQLKRMFLRFEESDQTGELRKRLPWVRPERMAKLREVSAAVGQCSPAALLERMNIHFRVRDAQQTGLEPASIDLIVSTGVIEYIPAHVLKSILTEFKRVGTPHAIQSHYVNLCDQYSYFDPTITPFNYLKYPARQWKYLNSPLTWQNRLRISDYRALFAETGYQIIRERDTAGDPVALRKVPLAPEFQHYKVEDLLVLFAWLVAKPLGA